MAAAASPTPSLTPSRSPTPELPIQPDHFYGSEDQKLPPSPNSDSKNYLDPEDDPTASRGIPVFKPTMDEFRDFEAYMNRVECWGNKSGIVKVIPPKEWTDALPALNQELAKVRLKSPIEQLMIGRGGLFRQQNVEKRRIMSVREWAELCSNEDYRAPGVDDIGLHARAAHAPTKKRQARKKVRQSETAEPGVDVPVKEEQEVDAQLPDDGASKSLASPPSSVAAPMSPAPVEHNVEEGDLTEVKPEIADDQTKGLLPDEEQALIDTQVDDDDEHGKPVLKGKRATQDRANREANRALKDEAFLETFDPHSDWLPENTTPFDYTPEFCKELERRFWRNCGFGKPAWYGADMQGSLFTKETASWNVATLHSALSRLLPASSQGLPGVNTPYLYFGMWRATFAWHVEDMDLFSINYIHFGAPKFWYACPQGKANTLESAMQSHFSPDGAKCAQFLRHKSYLVSPTLLSQSSCRPNVVVQHAGEFVITYPKGYHAGFNLGFNCAESVNFALESWLDVGRRAKACACVNFSVHIDVDQLIQDRHAERALEAKAQKTKRSRPTTHNSPRKRKSDSNDSGPEAKKQKTKTVKNDAEPSVAGKPVTSKVTLKLGPKPKELEAFPCCLCVSATQDKLLRVVDPPVKRKEGESLPGANGGSVVWMAHEECANVVPETWIDEVETNSLGSDGSRVKERVVYGVDGIVKDRWNLKCSACTKPRNRAHGAPIQCTKGKCPKAFHVSCARDGHSIGIVYSVLREVEKEVVWLETESARSDPSVDIVNSAVCDKSAQPMDMDDASLVHTGFANLSGSPDNVQVPKLIKKVELQVLCPQHNPAIAEAKRLQKQDKIRKDLLALPSMSRIKLRVSAGVFEVSLIRVIEETNSVEVLWDRGVKREFKWGSVVFGNTEGVTVGQKPTEAASEPEQSGARRTQHRLTLPPSTTASSIEYRSPPMALVSGAVPSTVKSAPVPSTSSAPVYQSSPTPHHPHPSTFQYTPGGWAYPYANQNVAPQYASSSQNFPYGHATHPAYQHSAPYQGYNGYSYAAQQFQSRGLQWQRPYTGPKQMISAHGPQVAQTVPYYAYDQTSGDNSSTYAQSQWSAAPPPQDEAPCPSSTMPTTA